MGHHDNLVKFAFSIPEHARGVLATALPPAVAARLDFSTLTHIQGSFVDESLRDRTTDLLFSTHIADRKVLLYLLCEHKSAPEALTPLQVLRYMVRIWDKHIAALPEKERASVRKLPVIVPIVLHHGREGWTTAATFEELLDADADLLAALGEHVPRLRLIVDDLAKQSDDHIYARAATAFARLVLWALKNAREAGWLDGDVGIWRALMAAADAQSDGRRALKALFEYIFRTNPTMKRDVVRGLIPGERGREIEEEMMNWFQQEVEQGERRGERRGEQNNARRMLLKQLRLRFGELPPVAIARVEAADVPQLDLWAERVITAARLEDVIEPA